VGTLGLSQLILHSPGWPCQNTLVLSQTWVSEKLNPANLPWYFKSVGRPEHDTLGIQMAGNPMMVGIELWKAPRSRVSFS
jgi:hypothetical protein